MERFSETVRSVCILSAGISAVSYFAAGTVLSKQTDTLLKMLLLMVLAAPFLKGGLSFELPQFQEYEYAVSEDTAYEYESELKRQTEKNISDVLWEQITACGIECEKIETEVNIPEDGSILISKVKVSADNFEKAEEIIRNSLGSETEVLNAYN